MTPSRKRVGKALARRSKWSTVLELLKDAATKQYIVKKIGILVRRELMQMCSEKVDSILSSQDLKAFSWKVFLAELSSNAPILLSILQSCTCTRKPRQNRDGVIGMCCAILLKFRYQKMCMVQKIISSILYAGNSGKQVAIAIESYVLRTSFHIRFMSAYKKFSLPCPM